MWLIQDCEQKTKRPSSGRALAKSDICIICPHSKIKASVCPVDKPFAFILPFVKVHKETPRPQFSTRSSNLTQSVKVNAILTEELGNLLDNPHQFFIPSELL